MVVVTSKEILLLAVSLTDPDSDLPVNGSFDAKKAEIYLIPDAVFKVL